ncbi:MAG: glycosyltransferase [Microthrixaceae bacterium]
MNNVAPRGTSILLTLWDGGGVVPPLLGIARRLVDHGHTVVVLGDPTIEHEATANGCTFTPWTHAPHRTTRDREGDLVRDYLGKPRRQMREFSDYFFTSGPAWTADTLRVIDDQQPDLVMADFMLIWAGVAAEIRGLPFVSLLTFPYAIPSPGFPPTGAALVPVPNLLRGPRDRFFGALSEMVYDRSKKVLNRLREEHGLPAHRHSLDQVRSAEAVIVLTSRSFDYPDHPAPDNVSWSGPILDDPAWAHTTFDAPWPDDDDRPIVVVAMSSTFQDQAATLQRTVQALSELPVRAVVSLGPALTVDEVPGADNVVVVDSIPHAQLIPRASLLVTHAGHGTAIKGLTAGVPMVCIPMGRDQGDNAARIIAAGCGIKLKRTASAAKIKGAIEHVLSDPSYGEAARRLVGTIAQRTGDTDPVTVIEGALERTR